MNLVDKAVLVAEIEKIYDEDYKFLPSDIVESVQDFRDEILRNINTLEVKEMDLYNNGWIDCTKQMPPETKQTSDTHNKVIESEWTESDLVLAWDSMYGCRVDATKNGKWMSEQGGGYTGQVVHEIIAWRPIPEFSEELLFKAQKGEE